MRHHDREDVFFVQYLGDIACKRSLHVVPVSGKDLVKYCTYSFRVIVYYLFSAQVVVVKF